MEKQRKPMDFVAENITNVALRLLEQRGEGSLPDEFLLGLIVVQSFAQHDLIAKQVQKNLCNGNSHRVEESTEV